MAYTYSTKQSFASSNSYGNVAMEVNIFRGDVTRTEKSVSFDFGVSFKPTVKNTTNSVVAWYGGTKKFAYANSGDHYDNAPVRANAGTTYYAYYYNKDYTRACTTQNLCFSYNNTSIKATTTSVTVSIGVGWSDWDGTNAGTLKFTIAIPEYHGACSGTKPVITDGGYNKFTISGSSTVGVNNGLDSVIVYYTTDGTDPDLDSNSKSTTTAGKYSFEISVPSSAKSCTVKAVAEYNFTYGSQIVEHATDTTVYRYKNGGNPEINILTDCGNSKFQVKTTLPADAWNNPLKTATLYYTTDGNTPSSSTYTKTVNLMSTTKAGGVFDNTYSIPSSCTKVKALVECTWTWSGQTGTTSDTEEADVTYYSNIDVSNVAIKITDHENNTFTITGTGGSNGTNNTATTTYDWGYSASYGNSGTVSKRSLTLTQANNKYPDTRTVYAKVTVKPSWQYDTNYKGGAGYVKEINLPISQYVAPTKAGKPALTANSLENGRATVRKAWTFTWGASTKANNNDYVRYRVALINSSTGRSMAMKGSGGTLLTTYRADDGFYYLDTYATELTIDPDETGLAPGDVVQLAVCGYLVTSNDASATFRRNYDNSTFSSGYAYSDEIPVKSPGIMRVKVGSVWKEGQVWVKVGGVWKEAASVHTKVSGTWKESQ